MQALIDKGIYKATKLWWDAVDIWLQGGWAMIAIAVIALVMFGVGMHIYLNLRGRAYKSVPEDTWRGWIEKPGRRRGMIGEMLDFVIGGDSIRQTAERFDQLRSQETKPFERDLRVMKVCVSAAPLVGLLGTVTGMLSTFGALSSGSGGDKTMSMVAQGISEALITTETGLVVALPGLFFQAQLQRRFAGYKAFIAHLETVCTQAIYKRQSKAKAAAAHREAAQQIARRVVGRIREEYGQDARGASKVPVEAGALSSSSTMPSPSDSNQANGSAERGPDSIA